MTPSLRLAGLAVRPRPQAAPLFAGVDLEVRPGEIVGVTGRSGAGKSTLLACIAGLVPWARPGLVAGVVALDGESIGDLDPAQRARLLAISLDRPDAQLFLATPRQELAAAVARYAPAPLASAIVDCLGVLPLLDRRVVSLSSGERQRLALATALVATPRPVLLDEPCAHLDDAGVRGLVAAFELVRRAGGSVLLVEQAGWRLSDAAIRWLALANGTLVPTPPPAAPVLPPPAHGPGAPVLSARSLGIARGGRSLMVDAHLELREGEVVLLSGANGCGKSSLARVLAGHARSAGIAVDRRSRLARPPFVALAMAETELQLFAPTVAEELGLSGHALAEAGERLRTYGLETLVARAPWTLSRGEKQRLLHAALDALDPAVTIVDELGQGLDPDDLVQLATTIRERSAAGRTYLLLTHRPELAALAHRRLRMVGGTMVEEA